MAKRIHQLAVAVAPELIRERHLHFRPGLHSLVEHIVHVRNIEENTHRRTADRFWRPAAGMRHLISKHEEGIADLDLGVRDFAIWTVHAAGFPGPEGALIEIDCPGGVVDHQVRSDGMITGRYRLN